MNATTQPPLPNDDAARTATGEILDARDQTKPATTPAATTSSSNPDTTSTPAATDGKDATATDTTKPADKPPADKTATTAPAAYTAFTAPDGATLDAKAIEAATPIFRELGLTQEQAQRLITLQATQQLEAARAADPAAVIRAQSDAWTAETLADPDIAKYSLDGKTGIEAVKLDIVRAKSVLTPAERDAFNAAMDSTGIGNNPAFVKAMWKMSQHISEGKHVGGRGPSPQGQVDPSKPVRPSAAQAMYPGLPSAANG